MASLTAKSYFSWHKYPGNRIFKQSERLKSYLGERYDNMTLQQQEDIIDDFVVDFEIRTKYKNDEADGEFPPSFPKLMIPSGEKIMVDESDLRTWRDAHSGPFSWKSKSQQDLTLSDLEPENLFKPHRGNKRSKSGNSESDSEDTSKEILAPAQFVFCENSWTQQVLAEYQIHLETYSSKPTSRASSPLEEDNPAFEGSVQDVRGNSEPSLKDKASESESSLQSADMNKKSKSHSDSPRKSTTSSPRKVTFSRSFQKDSNDSDTVEVLISKQKDSSQNAFSNPVLETEQDEWSTFVGQENEDEPQKDVQVTAEPPDLTMDRGVESSDHSVESTPDHTSKLLATPPDLAKAEAEEVLFVAVESTESEMNLSSFRKSGFDFLDEW